MTSTNVRPDDDTMIADFEKRFPDSDFGVKFATLSRNDQAQLAKFGWILSLPTKREQDIETIRIWAEEGDAESIAVLARIGIEVAPKLYAHDWDALSNCTKCGKGHVGWDSELSAVTCPVPDAAHV